VNDPWGRVFEQVNGAHVWFTAIRGAVITYEGGGESITVSADRMNDPLPDLTKIGGIDGVAETAGPYPVTPAFFALSRFGEPMTITALPAQLPSMGGPLVVDGRWLQADGEIVMDSLAAQRAGYRIGDSVEVIVVERPVKGMQLGQPVRDGKTLRYTMVGVALDPGFDFAGAAYVLPAAFDAMMGDRQPDYRYGVRLSDPEKTRHVIAAARALYPEGTGIRALDWLWTKRVADETVRVVAPFLLADTAAALRTSTPSAFNVPLMLLSVSGVTAVIFAATIHSALRAGRLSPVTAIKRPYGAAPRGMSLPARLAARAGLSPSFVMGINDASANPVRAVLTLMVLAVGIIMCTFTLGAEATFAEMQKSTAIAGDEPYHIRVNLNGYGEDDAVAAVRSQAEVEAVVTVGGGTVQVNGVAEAVHVRAVGEDYGNTPWWFLEGRMLRKPDEVVIGHGMAELYGLGAGDSVTLSAGGATRAVTISGVYRDLERDGVIIMMDIGAFRAAFDPALPVTGMGLMVKDRSRSASVAAAIRSASGDVLRVRPLSNDPGEVIWTIRPVLLFLTALLLGMATLNLLSTLFSTVMERRRDFAIAKAVGMAPRQVLASVVTGACFLGLMGLALGIPLGLYVTGALYDAVGEIVNAGPDLGVMPHAWMLLALVPVALAVAALGSWAPGRLAVRVPVVRALREE